jgi:hypothetical protein
MSVVVKATKAILLTPIVVVVVGVGGCETRKAFYDWQITRLCEKEGGVTVFDQVVVSAAEVRSLPKVGEILGIAPEALAKAEEPAFSRTQRTQLHSSGGVSVTRYETDIIRRSDGKLVARSVTFTRAGGDFPSFAHPSTFSCPEQVAIYKAMQGIYRVEGGRK